MTDWAELETYEQRDLADAMSEVSGRSYCSTWDSGCEVAIWRLIHSGGNYGMCHWEIADDEIERVRRASVAADCWLRWEGDGPGSGLVAVPLAEWAAAHPAQEAESR